MNDQTEQKPKLKGRGGPGRGGGRKPGQRPRYVIEREEKAKALLQKAKEEGLTPLEYMLRVMRKEPEPLPEPFDGEDKMAYMERLASYHKYVATHEAGRMEAAKNAAPYVHPRLAAIEHKGNITLAHEMALAELE